MRAACAFHLGEWIASDVTEVLKDEYLKYIGWLCSERCGAVRSEAVNALSKIVHATESCPGKMKHFVERFMPRFVDMAVGDIDESVQYDMMRVLRVLQKRGFMDSLPEEQLDKLDDVVFDSAFSLRLRREAMQFVMDHTEGFDFEAEGSGAGSGVGAGKKSKTTSAGDQAFANRRRNALLLESLTEFIEHHLLLPENDDDDEELGRADAEAMMVQEIKAMTAMLTEACDDLPSKQGAILSDWPTIVAMLLRDSSSTGGSVALVAPLSDLQASILVHLFVSRAMMARNDRRSGAAGSESDASWESLQQTVASAEFNRLLIRFKQDSANVAALLLLLEWCFDISGDGPGKASSNGSVSVKSINSGFKFVMELLSVSSDPAVITRVVKVVSQWNRSVRSNDSINVADKSGGRGGIMSLSSLSLSAGTGAMLDSKCVAAIKGNITELIASLWENATDAVEVLTSLADASSRSGGSNASKKGRKSSPQYRAADAEALTALHQLCHALRKVGALFKVMDCRACSDIFDDSSLTDVLKQLSQMSAVAMKFVDDSFNNPTAGETNTVCAGVATATCDVQLLLMLWYTRSVYVDVCNPAAAGAPGKSFRASSSSSAKAGYKSKRKGSEVGTENEAITVGIDTVLSIRDLVVARLNDWMLLEEAENSSIEWRDMNSVLRRYAFRAVGDIRLLYPQRLQSDSSIDASVAETEGLVGQYQHVGALAFTPGQETLQAMKNVFETERSYLAELLSINNSNAAVVSKLNGELVENILCPLGNPLLYDIEHMNRRQAAAILPYIIHSTPSEDDDSANNSQLSTGDSSELVRGVVVAWLKRLKAASVMRFLEVQLVALKAYYHSNVTELLTRQVQANHEDEEEDNNDYAEALVANYELLNDFAYQLAGTITTTKLSASSGSGSELLSGLESFVRASVQYAFSSVVSAAAESGSDSGADPDLDLACCTLGYFTVIDTYVALLPGDKARAVFDFMAEITADAGVASVLAAEEARHDPRLSKANVELQCYLEFKRKLQRKVGHLRSSTAVDARRAVPVVASPPEVESGAQRGQSAGNRGGRVAMGLVLEEIPDGESEDASEAGATSQEQGRQSRSQREQKTAAATASRAASASGAHNKRQRLSSQGKYLAEEEEEQDDDIYAEVTRAGGARKRYR